MATHGYLEMGGVLVPAWSEVGREELERRHRDFRALDQVRSLSFGFYAWEDDREEKRRVMEAGSGFIVAPRLGITAKHVCESFRKLDPQFDALARRSTPLDPQYRTIKVNAQYGAKAYQIAAGNPEPVGEEELAWGLNLAWQSHDTDIAVIRLEPRTAAAVAVEPHLQFFEWQLLPPPVGEMVRLYGFPDPKIETEGVNHLVESGLSTYQARVVEHIYPMGEHRFGDFPAFRLDSKFAHGFSGGPIFCNGRLAGVFTGPDLVASLWPLALHTYPDANGDDVCFADHFDSGLIRTSDWNSVKGRVERVPCHEALAGSSVESRCGRRHVVLQSGS